MPGPQKLYTARLKVSITHQTALELREASLATDTSQGELVRTCLEKHLKNVRKALERGTAQQRRRQRIAKAKDEIELVWGTYLRAREIWWRQVKEAAAPQEPKLTAKRSELILDSLEANGKQVTVLSGKGVWLSDYHTEHGFTGPEYAWRANNVHRFSTLVLETRIGG